MPKLGNSRLFILFPLFLFTGVLNWLIFSDPSTKEITIKPVTENEKNYVHITNDGLVTGVNPNAEANQLFDGIFKKYDKYILDATPNTNYLE